MLADSFSPHVGDLKALGTHWVRVFATWPIPAHPGDYSANWIPNYERLFNQLPAGTKVIVDVVDTPQWETGSSDEHTPPANPEDYAAFVGGLAQRFGPHVAAYELWNEEDSPAGGRRPRPRRLRRAAEGLLPRDQGRRTERDGACRRVDRQ